VRVAVIGAGIVGVTTAWELVQDGHEVTVFDRHASVAAEASFANAGVLAPGYVTPWSAPGMPGKVLLGLFSRHRAVRFGLRAWTEGSWLWRYLRACRSSTYLRHRTAMHALARYSVDRLGTMTRRHELDYERTQGYLVLLRSARELDRVSRGKALLDELGVRSEVLDATRCRQIEPGLSGATPLKGGLHLPEDRVGNCRQFAHQLTALARRQGVQFVFGREVVSLGTSSRVSLQTRRVCASGFEDAAPTDDAEQSFDAAVLCTGHQAADLLAPLGLPLPVRPVHGYSLTAPLRESASLEESAPRSGLMDERFKVAISRLGDRIRVAGSAEIGGHPEHMSPAALRTLYRVLDDWFPGAAVMSRVQHWKGGRPMLPDGPPLIGASGLPGVWLNLGHGSSGWALSCGSARLLADQLAGREPDVDPAVFQVSRLRL